MGGGDMFKELPLRILGFSFGIGQASKYRFSSRTFEMCNGVGTFFVVAHVFHAAITEKTVPAVLKALCFEGICTCIIPPVVNYYVCSFVAEILWDIGALPSIVKKWGPFVAGILTIPVLMTYVDPEIDNLIEGLFS